MMRPSNMLLITFCCLFLLGIVGNPAQAWAPIPKEETPQLLQFGEVVMAPAPYLANWLGASLRVRKAGVTLTGDGRTVQMTINSSNVTANGVTFEAPVLVVAGVVYVPLRPIMAIFGGSITLNHASQPERMVVTVTAPSGRTATWPLRGTILSVTGDFENRGVTDTAYGAYLSFGSPNNEWRNGKSYSNPNLPLVWIVQGGNTIWSKSFPEQDEIAQLAKGELTNDHRTALWFTTRLVGADYIGYFFRAYLGRGHAFRNLIASPDGSLEYTDNGGLLALVSQPPGKLILFDEVFGTPRVAGPVALTVTTYTWNGRRFALSAVQRTSGPYNGNMISTLRQEFKIRSRIIPYRRFVRETWRYNEASRPSRCSPLRYLLSSHRPPA